MDDDTSQNNIELNQKALNLFGAMLMKQVRDTQIELWDQTISGEVKYKDYQRLHEKLEQTFDPNQLAIIQGITKWVVDNTIAHFLGMLEERKEIDLAVHIDGQTVPSLRDVTDGLESALYTEDGWIAQFSKKEPINVQYFAEDVALKK